MRRIEEYSLWEWMRLIPIKWAIKHVRNVIASFVYSNIKAARQKEFILSVNNEFKSKNCRHVLFSVAFERPEVVKLQCQQMKKYIKDSLFVVVDNSRNDDVAKRIEFVCESFGVSYLKLPKQFTKHPNRNHSFALQWIFDNLVNEIKPIKFGFLDHDIMPFKKVSPFAKYRDCVVFGRRWESRINNSWQLWAGFAFFDFSKLPKGKINFLYDFSNGLDTLGGAYEKVFRNHECEDCFCDFSTNAEIDDLEYQVFDNEWIHMSRASLKNKKSFNERLAAFHKVLIEKESTA